MSANHSIRNVLQQTLEDIEIRSKIEECVRDLVTDVELSVQLQERIQTQKEILMLHNRLKEQEIIMEESYALREYRARQNVTLANQMTMELWNASREIGSLLSIKEQHAELLVKYDELVAKLLQAEDEIAYSKNNLQNATPSTGKGEDQNEHEDVHDQKSQDSSDAGNIAATSTVLESQDPISLKAGKSTETTTVIPLTGEIPDVTSALAPTEAGTRPLLEDVDDAASIATSSPPELSADLSQEPVVVMIDDDEDGVPPTLDQLDTAILLHVFLFLDPLDVLNTAQINIAMYSRVDSLFNPGSSGSGDGDDAPAPSDETAEVNTLVDEQVQAEVAPQNTQPISPVPDPVIANTTSVISPMPAATITEPLQVPPAQHQPTLASLPATQTPSIASPPRVRPDSMVSAPTTTALSSSQSSSVKLSTISISSKVASPTVTSNALTASTTPGSRGIFSILQPKHRPSVTPPRSRGGSVDVASQQQSQAVPYQPLNAAMASSMAAKLSDAELNAIILMTERLKQKEQLVAQYKAEKDSLTAKLDGTESVKQFLIDKVRYMEASLNASFNNEIKVAQQSESDQEVIAYLDGKVQELENQLKTSQAESKSVLEELDVVRKQAIEKATVMGDMLQFEREKLQENEREWKATRKLLIKEVKNLRTQITSLQAERDGYREEKDALSRAGGGSGIGYNGYYRNLYSNSNSSSIGRTGSFT